MLADRLQRVTLALAATLLPMTLYGLLPPGAAHGQAAGAATAPRVDRVPLAVRLRSLQRAGIAEPFRDRRVDPDAVLEIDAAGDTIEALSASLAAAGYGLSRLGGALYVGPTRSAANLRTLAQTANDSADRADARSRRALRRVDSLTWPALTEPRALIQSLLAAHGLTLANPEAIPMDVWAEGGLPPAPLADRLTLLLVGFDLTWAPAGSPGALKLLPAPARPAIEVTYPAPASDAWDRAAFALEFPEAELDSRGDKLVLRGRVEAHERLAAVLAGGATPAAARGARRPTPEREERVTLTVSNQPALAVLEKLSTTLGLRLEYQRGAEQQLRAMLGRRIDLVVEQATLESLLAELGSKAGVALSLRDGVIAVGEAGP